MSQLEFQNAEISDEDMITDWLNNASISTNSSEKIQLLHKTQEFLIRKAPHLLPKLLPNVLGFTSDRNGDVKKCLVGFIEEACKVNESLLSLVMINLHMLLCDESVQVQKRVIQATITIYRKMLHWLCTVTFITPEIEEAWNRLNVIKVEIVNMIDSDNDGVRTSSVKFLECVVLCQTYPDQNENQQENDFSLENIPLTLKIARRRKLEEEAKHIFSLLVKFHGSPHISSANLFAAIGALTNIAKNRPEFMERVVNALETLQTNLPPTLGSTQVNSVRKKLKSELTSLVKHPAAADFISNISSVLTELGCTLSELSKLIPREERKRFLKRTTDAPSAPAVKRQRVEEDLGENVNEKSQILLNYNVSEQAIADKLTLDNLVPLIISTFNHLPEQAPTQFVQNYSTMMKMNGFGQMRFISKLLSEYLTECKEDVTKLDITIKEEPEDGVPKKVKKNDEDLDEKMVQFKEKIIKPRIKTLKLGEITKPLDRGTKGFLLSSAVRRVLQVDKNSSMQVHQKIVTTMASTFNDNVRETILSFLMADLRSHVDLCLAWLYEEYSIMQGFSRLPSIRHDICPGQNYNSLLCSCVRHCTADAVILSRMVLEAPMITDEVLQILGTICRDEARCNWATGLLKDLALRRPPKQLVFVNAILAHTTHDSHVIRETTMMHILDLYEKPEQRAIIEEFARLHLDFLKFSQPPEILFGCSQGRENQNKSVWSEEMIKSCLYPYLALLPINESLIHDLAKVYTQTNADTKRTILRLLEAPVRGMGMDSPDLLKLVEECPKGSETLVTRLIHILTDRGPPSAQLVARVRELYQTRISDVRFLIPVLNGLTKKEVIAALPKLIKLNPVVVREVFNRLLGLHGDSPISPSELLIALHVVDTSKADLKTTMKATSLCLNERQVFTQEVLAVVIQQLMEQTPLPTLLMRTVLQALSFYPRLSGFVMNILQRLILKQVWRQKVVWEGFVRCCQRTRPQSFAVLLQLPAPQLTEALTMCPELSTSLKEHVMSFTDGQRTHVPVAVLEILMGTKPEPVSTPMDTTVLGESVVESIVPQVMSNEPLPPGMD